MSSSGRTGGSPPAQDVVVPLGAKLIAGGIAGIIGTSIIFPIDLVKTRLQKQGTGVGAIYSGPLDAFRKITAAEGVKGLYSGLKPNLVGVFPEKALKLSVNDVLREHFTASNGDGQIKVYQEIVAGGGAGFTQVAITNPMEIVKLRMQVAGETPGAPRLSAMQTITELGPRGLYKGIGACWLRDVPFSFVFFPLFAHLKRMLHGNDSIVGLFAAGAAAGSLSAGLVTPADVVKTRLQLRENTGKYTGVGHCITTIWKEEGALAFTKGWLPRMLVQAPLFGCTLLSYEVLKAIYRRKM